MLSYGSFLEGRVCFGHYGSTDTAFRSKNVEYINGLGERYGVCESIAAPRTDIMVTLSAFLRMAPIFRAEGLAENLHKVSVRETRGDGKRDEAATGG